MAAAGLRADSGPLRTVSAMHSNSITAAGKARLEAHLAQVDADLAATDVEIESARSGAGDSEGLNAVEAIQRRGQLQTRRSQLLAQLEDAVVVESGATDSVSTGAVVDLDFGDGDLERFCFGSRHDGVDGLDVITPDSPLGAALSGQRPGATVTVEMPSGATYQVTIAAII